MRRDLSTRLSQKVIEYALSQLRITQEQLAERMELSASFVSRVRSGERGLGTHHLLQLEAVMDRPLGAILLAADPEPRVSKDPKLTELYRRGKELAIAASKVDELIYKHRQAQRAKRAVTAAAKRSPAA